MTELEKLYAEYGKLVIQSKLVQARIIEVEEKIRIELQKQQSQEAQNNG